MNYKILMSKLYRYGIRRIAYQLFKDYLTPRYQYTAINNNTMSKAYLINNTMSK